MELIETVTALRENKQEQIRLIEEQISLLKRMIEILEKEGGDI